MNSRSAYYDRIAPQHMAPLWTRLKALVRRAEGRAHSAIIIYGQFECHVKARTCFRRNQHIALSANSGLLYHEGMLKPLRARCARALLPGCRFDFRALDETA